MTFELWHSVSPHGRLHAVGPGFDAAGEVEDLFVTGVAQPVAGALGAHAVVAVNDDSAVLVHEPARRLLRDLGKGDELGPLQPANLELVFLTHIDEAEVARTGTA